LAQENYNAAPTEITALYDVFRAIDSKGMSDLKASTINRHKNAKKNREDRITWGIEIIFADLYLNQLELDTARSLAQGVITSLDGSDIKDTELYTRAYNILARIASAEQDEKKALQAYLQAFPYALSVEDSDLRSSAYYNLAATYSILGNPNEAVKYYEEVLKQDLENKDSINIAYDYRSIGLLYDEIGNDQKALEYLEEGIQYCKPTELSHRYTRHCCSIAMIAANQGALAKAKKYTALAETTLGQLQSPMDLAEVQYQLAYAKWKINDIPSAQSYIAEANEVAQKHDLKILSAKILLLQSQLSSDSNSKLKLLEKGLVLAHSNSKLRDRISEVLMTEYQKSKSTDKLINLQTSYIANTQSQHKSVIDNIYSNIDTKIELIESQKDLELQKILAAQKSNKMKILWWAVTILCLGGAVLGILLFRIWKQKRLIAQQKSKLQSALKEKDFLLKEIHHRVKNNLQVISSLLYMQAEGTKDQNAYHALNEGRNRVKSMALIHQNLYTHDHITGVNLKDYLEELVSNLFETYNIQGNRIQLSMNIEPILLDVETVVPLGLVINELVSNSLKHGFPDPDTHGEINVSVLEHSDGLKIQIKDNGIGLQGRFLKNGGTSFGSVLVKSFTDKIKAELIIEDVPGTSIVILISKYKKAA